MLREFNYQRGIQRNAREGGNVVNDNRNGRSLRDRRIVREVDIERHLVFEIEGIFHQNRIHSNIRGFFRELYGCLRGFHACTGQERHGRR